MHTLHRGCVVLRITPGALCAIKLLDLLCPLKTPSPQMSGRATATQKVYISTELVSATPCYYVYDHIK